MLCDDCGRNEAVIHITQIGPDGRVEKNLCEHCASKYGDFLFQPRMGAKDMSVNDFLKGIFSHGDNAPEVPAPKGQPELVCPNCGMSYSDFLQTGKIGCSVCYSTFRDQLEPVLRRIHGSSTHSGKVPHRSGGTLVLKQQIAQLARKQQEAVAREAYEQAAAYRDQIRALRGQLAQEEQQELPQGQTEGGGRA